MIEHLDRIEKLGFNPVLNWNKSFEINFDIREYDGTTINQFPFDIKILFCNYHLSDSVSYEEVIETACDFFYSWYNKNLDNLKDFEVDSNSKNLDKLQDSIFGDITSRVYRDLNLDNLFY